MITRRDFLKCLAAIPIIPTISYAGETEPTDEFKKGLENRDGKAIEITDSHGISLGDTITIGDGSPLKVINITRNKMTVGDLPTITQPARKEMPYYRRFETKKRHYR